MFFLDPAIEVKNLSKIFRLKQHSTSSLRNTFFPNFQSFKAIDNVSFKVKKNETFGLLGPNGAGKTTLVRCLTNLLLPTEGTVLIEGRPVSDSVYKIGGMFSYSMIYRRMTGYDNLKFFAKIYGVKDYKARIAELDSLFELGSWLDNLVENYSLGMKSKLAFARALIHNPEIVFLDEPTLGLDPNIALKLRKEILKMNKTIFLTTHYMEEANELCDKIAIMNEGKIIVKGSPEELKELVKQNQVVLISVSKQADELKKILYESEIVHAVSPTHDGFKILLRQKSDISELLLILSKFKIDKIVEEEPKLVDVFVKLTGGKIEKVCE